jgi:parvulin-like peptidyl-prolyl isomerase
MPSNRRFAFCCLVQLSICASFAAAQTAPPADKYPVDTVVARQGSATLTLADIDAFAQKIDAKQRPGFFDNPKRLESLISNLLVQRELAQEAEKDGLGKNAAVQAQIRIATEEILGKARVEQLRTDVKLPDFDQRAHEEYLGHKEKYVKLGQLDVKQILISTEKHTDAEAKALADDVRKQAVAHPDQFDALIEKYSEDPSKAQNHGLMTDANSKRYVAQFTAAAVALKMPGEISPIVKTKFGYHVLKLVKRTSDEPLKYEEVKAEIIEQLRASYIDKAVSTHTDELRNQHIDANPEVVASLRGRYGALQVPPSDLEAAPAPDDKTPPR